MTKKHITEDDARSDNFKNIVRLEVSSKDDFRTSTVRSLYEWWSEYYPSVPRREDFDVSNHWSIAPSLYMIEVVGPGEYRHRLNGETVVDIVGVSLRGHEISASCPLPELRRLAAYFDILVEGRKSFRCNGIAEAFGTKYSEFETVDCPLLDQNGNVGFILGAISLIE